MNLLKWIYLYFCNEICIRMWLGKDSLLKMMKKEFKGLDNI